MEIQKIINQALWDEKLLELDSGSSFAQSFVWGEIQQQEGGRVERWSVQENGVTYLMAQLFFKSLPFGWQYVFCPLGPISTQDEGKKKEACKFLLESLHKEGAVFLRIEPKENPVVVDFNLEKTTDLNPAATFVLNLEKSEDELLSDLHIRTRYNIHLAQKKNLRIVWGKNADVFWKLSESTAARDGFRLHARTHYENILASSAVEQATVYSGDTPAVSGIFIHFGDTYTHLFGASNHELRAQKAAPWLQWEVIKKIKQQEYKKYDFFGVAPKIGKGPEYVYDQKHQYAGISAFKAGFSGDYVERAGTWDLIIDAGRYRVYKLLRRLRRIF